MSETKEEIVLPFIEGEVVSLCTANLDHINLYAGWMNHPETRKYLPWSSYRMPQTIDEIKKMFEPKKDSVKDEIFFEIWHKEEKKPIGFAYLYRIQWFTRNAYLFFLLDPKYQKQKIGTEVCKLLLDYAYKELNLHKITVRLYAPNKVSIHLAEKVGFKHEITFKKEVYFDGEHVDAHEYIIFKDDWLK
ncbi:MAG: GNAT family N-acetyltransferase [Promethearchaeota archaeon]